MDFGKSVIENFFPRCRRELFQKYSELCNQPKLAALLKLLSNPWFNRVWVIQEVVNSTAVTVRYGQHQFHWDKLGQAVMVFLDNEGISTMAQARKDYGHHTLDGLESAQLMHHLK
jgi:hypothetical protein